ncbi:MAG: TetR family transcriptional regulator [Gammaproteobacteria bacterium]
MARPRAFDRDEVLARAMSLFWARGYAGASLDALDAATGLNRGSVYNAFGDKRGLYLEALEHYGQLEIGAAARAVRNGGPAPGAIGGLFHDAVEHMASQGSQRTGCFMCNAAIELAPVDAHVAERVRLHLGALRDAFAASLERYCGSGTSENVIAQTADHLLAAYMGLQVLAKAGCPAEQLRSTAESVLAMVERLETK